MAIVFLDVGVVVLSRRCSGVAKLSREVVVGVGPAGLFASLVPLDCVALIEFALGVDAAVLVLLLLIVVGGAFVWLEDAGDTLRGGG
jgi:hypothetical protein